MKTSNSNKLAFAKSSVAELNQMEMMGINGGSTILGGETCPGCVCIPVKTIIQNQFLAA
ncbi:MULTISPECIES: class I lanthipeptide [unclassified Flavobacterium]|uniref:class I lanthipeptide n=1 Tax=unclassified Flavobacterium TaxID=196869 RepID=UPI001AC5338F|nr:MULTISPECIES: class I lanthipeptide [unclassified Flavobacterium]MBN9283338.1 class I lanthipeptide [Flavobacterium sp.]